MTRSWDIITAAAGVGLMVFMLGFVLMGFRQPHETPNSVSLTSTNLPALQHAEAILEAGDSTITLDIEDDAPAADERPRYHLYSVD